ncbi:unnamed protein product, partial [Cladocopium goreaui]
MAEAPPPKKRKLDGPWFRDCLQEFDETVKTNVATKLDKFSEKDLYTATFDALMSLLKSAISDENLREQVALRLHNNLRAVPVQDDLCKWLEEAVQKKPSEWKANEVKEFDAYILGNVDMKKKLIVRDCFVKMKDEAMKWLRGRLENLPIGLFVITGTPGIGKSIFLAYMAGFLAEKNYDIVIQRGQEWWSRARGKIVAHGREEPLNFLKNAETVLLFDPIGGENRTPLQNRDMGCSMVFTSPSRSSYHSAYNQQRVHSAVRFMPVWTKEEVQRFKHVMFAPDPLEESVNKAYSSLGGTVRLLQQHLIQEESVENIVENYMGGISTAELKHVANVTVVVGLLEKKLEIRGKQERLDFINTFMSMSPLGTVVGSFFEKHVKQELTSDKAMKLALKGICAKGITIIVPNKEEEVKKAPDLTKILPDRLYCPSSKTFPAADFFFVTVKAKKQEDLTLWLLQTTKAEGHSFKLKALQDVMNKHFEK